MGKSATSTDAPESTVREKPANGKTPGFTIELEQEDDGRWLAEVVDVPGVMTYGASSREAVIAAKALLLRVLADRLDNGEPIPASIDDLFSDP